MDPQDASSTPVARDGDGQAKKKSHFSDEDYDDGLDLDFDDLFDDDPAGANGATDPNAALKELWAKSGEEAKREQRAKAVRKPRPKLTEIELTGPKGLGTLRNMFLDFQPAANARPYDKLNAMLGMMENWAHNLYPPLNLDDFLARMEPLGRKKRVRLAMGLLRSGGTLLDLDSLVGHDDDIIRMTADDGATLEPTREKPPPRMDRQPQTPNPAPDDDVWFYSSEEEGEESHEKNGGAGLS